MAKLNVPTLLVLFASTSLIPTALAAYSLADSYTASNWFDSFVFFDQKDPTNGFVQYKDLKSAASSGLIAIDGSDDDAAVYMGVDHTTEDPAGRASIRISSKKSYNHGLFIFDIEHNPGSICGTWPAAWLLSDSGKWPIGGEIDIFEGANDQSHNKMTLHTTSGCQIKPTGFSGKIDTPDCDVNAQGQGKNMGCGISHDMGDGQSYGKGMNTIGGGVYATMWSSQDIAIYHFPRSLIPADITSGNPDPTKWGMPVAKFAGGCDIDEHFQNLNIIFNTAFCGDWAGEAWNSSTTCQAKAPTCQAYVQNNPDAFKDAYWMIRSVKVYQEGKTATRRNRVIARDTSFPNEPETIPEAVAFEIAAEEAKLVRRLNLGSFNGKHRDCVDNCQQWGLQAKMITEDVEKCECSMPGSTNLGTKRSIAERALEENVEGADSGDDDSPLDKRNVFSDAWADMKHVWKCALGKCKPKGKRDLYAAAASEESYGIDTASPPN